MDKLKTRVLFISLILLALLSVSVVAAADSDDVISANQEDFDLSEETITDVELTNANAQEEDPVVSTDKVISDSKDKLSAEGDGNYSDLQTLIDATGSGETLVLENNYARANRETFLNITKEITIDGQGKTIDASLGNILRATAKVTLKNIVFINFNSTSSYGAIYLNAGSDGSTIENCTFTGNSDVLNSYPVIRWVSNDGKLVDSTFEDIKSKRTFGGIVEWESENALVDGCNFNNIAVNSSANIIDFKSNGSKLTNSNFTNTLMQGSFGSKTVYVRGNDSLIEGCNFITDGASVGPSVDVLGENAKINNCNFTNSNCTYGALRISPSANNAAIENSNFNGISTGVKGGMIYSQANNTSIRNSNFTDINCSSSMPAAIYFSAAENATVDACNFNNVEAASSVISSKAINTNILNSNFTNAKAIDGGVQLKPESVDSTIENCNFIEDSHNNLGSVINWDSDNGKLLNSNFTLKDSSASMSVVHWEAENGLVDGCSFISDDSSEVTSAILFDGANQILNNSNFTNFNTYRSAVDLYTSAIDSTVENCNFVDNKVSLFEGGAIYWFGENGKLLNSNFTGNKAEKSFGGAVQWVAANGLIDGCNFTDNEAKGGGGAINYMGESANNQKITNSYFSNNQAGSSGGAIMSGIDNITIDNCAFEENSANNRGGAIASNSFAEVNITNSNFTKNTANDEGGAVFTVSTGSIFMDNNDFTNNTADFGGAISIDESDVSHVDITISNSNFTENKATSEGGAIDSESNLTVDTCKFDKNEAENGGAIYGAYIGVALNVIGSEFNENAASSYGGAVYSLGSDSTIDNSQFNKNNAAVGGALYAALGSNILINGSDFLENQASYAGGAAYFDQKSNNVAIKNSNFISNNASLYGGAVLSNVQSLNIDNVIFNDNNASAGSAIFHAAGTLGVSNSELIENQALAKSLTLEPIVDKFDVVFKTTFEGYDNILNAIYSNKNASVTFENVKYHGVNEEMNTGSDIVTPVASADESNDGELVYADLREAGINITLCVYDEDGNLVLNTTKMTNVYGDINITEFGLKPGKYRATAVHEEDAYYTYIETETEFEVLKQDVIVNVDRVVNYTGAVVDVIANVTDADGNPIDGGTATFIIHYDNKIGSGLLMATSESYTAEVVEGQAVFKDITLGAPGLYPSTIQYSGNDYYNSAENESEVEVLPLNTTTSGDDVSGTAGDKVDITADIVDQNGNPVKNGTAVLKVNGKEYTAEVKDGKATFKDVELPSKSTPATIEYLGNDYYNPSNTTIQITVKDKPTPKPEPPVPDDDNKTTPSPGPSSKNHISLATPVTANPIALAVIAVLSLVSTVSLGRKK